MKRERQLLTTDEILNLHNGGLQRQCPHKVLVSWRGLLFYCRDTINTNCYKLCLPLMIGNWCKGAPGGLTQRGVPSLLKPIKLDQLRTVGACTVCLMVLFAAYCVAAAPSLLCVTLQLTANTSRPWPPWSPASPQPASRWALLMSSSRSSGVGLFFPGLEGATEGAEGVCWLGQHQAGGWGWDKEEKQRRESWKSHFSDLINGEFVYECGKIECEGCVRKKLVPHGALWNTSPFCALWSVFIVIDCTVVCLFLCLLKAFSLLLQCRYSRVNNPSFICDVIHVKENAVTNGSICLMLPASAFVSSAFDVIDTWCFQGHKSSALQCLAQNKSWREGTLCEVCVWISTSEGKGRVVMFWV